MVEIGKHPDKKNAISILGAAEKQMNYTLKLESSDDSSFNIIRNIYECFRMLGDALMVSQGRVSKDHIEPIEEVEKIKIETNRPIKLIDNLKRMRQGINYYGYTPKKPESDDAISFAKECFFPLLKKIKEEISKNQNRRFL